MFCSNCGKEIDGGMEFCPACGAQTREEGMQAQNTKEAQTLESGETVQQDLPGIEVREEFEEISRMAQKVRKSEKMWSMIGKILAVCAALLMGRLIFMDIEPIVNGEMSIWYLVCEVATFILLICIIVYVYLKITLPGVHVKKNTLAEEYLKQISVNDNPALMKAVNEMNSPAVKSAYMDENRNVCIQGKKYKHTFWHEEGVLTLVSEKDNYKAALEKESIAGWLLKFLAPDAPINAYENQRYNNRLSKMELISRVIAAISMAVFVFFAVQPGVLEGTNRYVQMVKDGHPEIYPDVSYGDAFDAFFDECSWEYFKSEEKLDVVEFHGNCLLDEEKAEVGIQFVLDCEEGTFELHAVSIDGEPQTELTNGLLMLSVFENYGSKDKAKALPDEKKEDAQDTAPSDEGEAEAKQETAEQEIGKDLFYPIMCQGYADGYSPCPVMVNDEVSGQTKSGTYEEMLASLIDDGATMYAPPVMYEKEIYTAIKWDAPESEWYDGLLTHDQFISVVDWMRGVHEETGAENMFSSGSWEDAEILSGRWSGGGAELAISIYSDFSYCSAYSEIGSITVGDERGTIYFFGTEGSNLYIWCYMDSGEELILCHKGNGTMQTWYATDGIAAETGTQFQCVERFES